MERFAARREDRAPNPNQFGAARCAHLADLPRERREGRRPEPEGIARAFSLAVTSGKGGVGKTNLVTNLAVALARRGRRVVLLDGDMSLANVDLLLGVVPQRSLYDLLLGRASIEEIILPGPFGMRIIPAASGIEEMANLDDYRREVLLRSLSALEQEADFLLVDAGSGIQRQSLRLSQVADEILIVTTPEPTAFADAYALLKILLRRKLARPPRLLLNMVHSREEAHRVWRRICAVARRFLAFEPELWGFIYHDQSVGRAVVAQEPFVTLYPTSLAASCVEDLATRVEQPPSPSGPTRHLVNGDDVKGDGEAGAVNRGNRHPTNGSAIPGAEPRVETREAA